MIPFIYPLETECDGPDQCARTAQADLGRYITQRPHCWFLSWTALIYNREQHCEYQQRQRKAGLLASTNSAGSDKPVH